MPLDFDQQVGFLVQEIHKAELDAFFYEKSAKDAKHLANGLRYDLRKLLEDSGVKSMETEMALITVKPAPVSVLIPDNEAVPEEFCRIKKEPDKTRIKEFLKHNKCNWATLSDRDNTIQLKTKERLCATISN